MNHQIMIVFACRYAHDRKTGGALAVVRYVLSVWEELSLQTKQQLVQESEQCATCNFEDWQLLAGRLSNELET